MPTAPSPADPASLPNPAGSGRSVPSFLIKPVAALALIALADQLFFVRALSHGWLGVFGLALVAVLIMVRPAVRRDRRAVLAAGMAVLFAAAMIRDASPLAFVLFWIALGLATLLPATARFGDGWRWFQRLLIHGAKALFGPLIDLIQLHRVRSRRPVEGISLRRVLPTLVLPVIGSLVILALFSAANPVIEQVIASLQLPSFSERTLGRIVFWGTLFVMIWGVLRPRAVRRMLGTFDGTGDLALPGVTPGSVLLSLIAFNLLFAVQNGMDMAWLWGLLPLPGTMTLADYAHRGAYPLVATALLAALFVLITLRPGSATASSPAIRRLVVLWIGQNVVLVTSSMLRTLDYIDAYSLTQLRIAALAWMVLVAAGLVLIVWRLLREKSSGWLINANLAAAAALLGTYAFVDTGAMAAQWNVRHAREVDGTGAGIDLCYLNQLDGSALLPLIELEKRPLAPALKARVRTVREDVHARLERQLAGGGWTWLGATRLMRANILLKGSPSPAPRTSRHGCGGEPVYDAAESAEAEVPLASSPALTGAAER